MSEIDRRMVLGVAGLAGVAALSRISKAGPIEPPPGPVMPTGRSLREVEPRMPLSRVGGSPSAVVEISQPGTYYMTGDIVVPGGKSGIVVTAGTGGVCIDMMGFTIRGDGSGATGAGISCATPGPDYLEVCDGFIADMDGDGIAGGGAGILEAYDLHIRHCARGIVIDRDSGIVESCHIERCAGDGMVWEKSSATPVCLVVDDCEFRSNGGSGLAIRGDWSSGDGSLWIGECDSIGNTLDGFHITLVSSSPLGASFSGQMSGLCATGNGRHGSRNSVASLAGASGARCMLQMEDIVCTNNALGGMRVFNLHADMMDCDCTGNQGFGFELEQFEGSVDGCVSSRNAGQGFRMRGPGHVTLCDCAANGNTGEGYMLDQACRGVSVTECDAQGNGAGFTVQGSGNLLLWNTASGNSGSNYVFDPVTNPMVVLAPSDLSSSMNPHANYSL